MRTLIAAIVCGALIVILPANSIAVGVYIVGKEECDCSPLVAKGIVPDTLNTLSEALLVPQISYYLDKLAVEMKGMIVLADTTDGLTETTENGKISETPAKSEEQKPAKEEKSAVEKKAKDKKPTVQSKKEEDKKSKAKQQKRRVKMPPKAM